MIGGFDWPQRPAGDDIARIGDQAGRDVICDSGACLRMRDRDPAPR